MEETNIFIPRITDAYRRNSFIGYNWIDPDNSGLYSELVLCEESMVYLEAKDGCITPAATHCELPGDALDNCITCGETEIYINPVDGSCISECPTGYYPRDDINIHALAHYITNVLHVLIRLIMYLIYIYVF